MVAYFSPVSPAMVPAATTAPVVSMVPPIQAPVTISESPIHFASAGISTIMGMATINTMEMIKESFFLSPLMAPAVAMAAETPQIDTPLASIVANSSSTFIFRAIQKVKYHTATTTMTAWISPKEPAERISPNKMVEPSKTRPVLT